MSARARLGLILVVVGFALLWGRFPAPGGLAGHLWRPMGPCAEARQDPGAMQESHRDARLQLLITRTDMHVHDLAGLLSPSELEELRVQARNLKTRTGVDMIVVTIENLSLYGESDVMTLAEELLHTWRARCPPVARILLLVSRDDRATAAALSGEWSESQTKRLRAFIEGDVRHQVRGERFAVGIRAAVREIAATAERPAPVTEQPVVGQDWFYLVLLLMGLALLLLLGHSVVTAGEDGWGYQLLYIVVWGWLWWLLRRPQRRRRWGGSSGSWEEDSHSSDGRGSGSGSGGSGGRS